MNPKPKEKRAHSLMRLARRRRYAITLGAALIILLYISGAVVNWFVESDPVRRWDGISHDRRFKLRGERPASSDVTIVGITASSLDHSSFGSLADKSEAVRMMRDNVWPWPRAIHARVIDRLFELGARVVAVDIVFSAPRPGDEELTAVMAKYPGRIVLASVIQSNVDPAGRTFNVLLTPNPAFTDAAGPHSSGLANFPQHRENIDGVIRRFDFRTSELRLMGHNDDSNDLPILATQAVELFTRGTLPSRHEEIIPYAGGASTYEYIPVELLFDDAQIAGDSARFRRGEVFRDKLVFYGPIAEVMHDVHQTPFGTMPGVEIHAQLAAAMLGNNYVSVAPFGVSTFLAFVTTIGSALLVLRLRSPFVQTVAIAALLAVTYAATQFAFNRWSIFFPTTAWFFGGFAAGSFGIIYSFFLTLWEKKQTRSTLDRFTGTRVAEVILRNAEEFESTRRGERRPVAVLFSDIRSFTSWTETAQPEHLVGQMNEYFNEMFEHIEATGGNLQKFIGDAILAAWGDTDRQTPDGRLDRGTPEGNAVSAVRTMLAMRTALVKLNATWRGREDRREISIGIGINHGDVVVGEVGAAKRTEFTVLGDGVNFAARLESATKQFHTDCLVGESVEVLTRGAFQFRLLGNLRVKGKSRPVKIFTPLDAGSSPRWLEDYHRAITMHDDRDFTGAITLFRDVKARMGSDDFLCDWYIAKCEAFLIAPPPADWDGSHALAEK